MRHIPFDKRNRKTLFGNKQRAQKEQVVSNTTGRLLPLKLEICWRLRHNSKRLAPDRVMDLCWEKMS